MLLNEDNYLNGVSTMEKAYCRTCDTDAEIHTMAEICPEHGIEKNQE